MLRRKKLHPRSYPPDIVTRRFSFFKKNQKAQAIMGEYVLVFFLVAAVMASMTVFFKRAVQSRIDGAQKMAFGAVYQTVVGNEGYLKASKLHIEYEPYYTNSITLYKTDSADRDELLPTGTSGIYRRQLNQIKTSDTNVVTFPPKCVDADCSPESVPESRRRR